MGGAPARVARVVTKCGVAGETTGVAGETTGVRGEMSGVAHQAPGVRGEHRGATGAEAGRAWHARYNAGMSRRVHRPSGATYSVATLLREADALSSRLCAAARHAPDWVAPALVDTASDLDAATDMLKKAHADLEVLRSKTRTLRDCKDKALRCLQGWIGSVHDFAHPGATLPRRPPRNSRNAPLLVTYAAMLAPLAHASLAREGPRRAGDLRVAHDEHAKARWHVPELLRVLRQAKLAVYFAIRAGTHLGRIVDREDRSHRFTMKGLRR